MSTSLGGFAGVGDEAEFELGGRAEHLLQPCRVLQARHFDENAVGALLLDVRLGRAERIDAAAQHFDRLLDGTANLVVKRVVRHRMLDLDAGVHLEEVEAAVVGEQEFDRPRADVADRRRGLDGGPADLRAKFGRDRRRRRFLDQLLMTALYGAVALADMDDRPLGVGHYLELDMAGADKVSRSGDAPLPKAFSASARGGTQRRL